MSESMPNPVVRSLVSPSTFVHTSSNRMEINPSSAYNYDDQTVLASGLEFLGGLDITEYLEQDDRPTFVMDAKMGAGDDVHALRVVFCNHALRTYPRLLESTFDFNTSKLLDLTFATWVSSCGDATSYQSTSAFENFIWSRAILQERWIVVRAASIKPSLNSSNDNAANSLSSGHKNKRVKLSPNGAGVRNVPGFVRPPRTGTNLTQTSNVQPRLISASPSQLPKGYEFSTDTVEFLLAYNLVKAEPNPSILYWGSGRQLLYNKSFDAIMNIGHSLDLPCAEDSCDVCNLLIKYWQHDKTMNVRNSRIFLRRGARLEENYFISSFMPVHLLDGSTGGWIQSIFDTTSQTIADRRLATLQEVSGMATSSTDLKDFWKSLIQALQHNEFDLPVAAFYVKDNSGIELFSSATGDTQLSSELVYASLRAVVGVEGGHILAPTILGLGNDNGALNTAYRRAIKTRELIVLRKEDNTLPSLGLQDFQDRGFGESCQSVVVGPLIGQDAEALLGSFTICLNTRRPFDKSYQLFIHVLVKQIATTMASVTLREQRAEHEKRTVKTALLERDEYSNQVAARTLEAAAAEAKFRCMASLISVGMYIILPTGTFLYANDATYNISGHERSDNSPFSWANVVAPEFIPHIQEEWHKLAVMSCPISSEIRLKVRWSRGLLSGPTWILASAFPELESDGSVKWIMGTVTDISHQKAVEELLRNRAEEATNWKDKLEKFVDITSHEVRNPLSAILQSADEITTSFSAFRQELNQSQAAITELVESGIDAARTIELCAHHQKRIVEDIGTLSKLDSELISLAPTDTQPVALVESVARMFLNELKQHGINFSLVIRQSYHQLQIDQLRLDPSRLTQILINLLTNAIKFTKLEDMRKITVFVDGFTEKPNFNHESSYPSGATADEDVTVLLGSLQTEPIFLQIAVEDTGPGMTNLESESIFQRFSQASPRTHIKYGGSGLGLFISRKLTELQGGQIAVTSEVGIGSTFTFYIAAQRSLQT